METPFVFWLGFNLAVVVLLVLDLTLLRRQREGPSLLQSFLTTLVWVILAVAFGFWIVHEAGWGKGTEFFTGYVIEYSLSVDNLFLFVLIFSNFRVPPLQQRRLLFWGVIGALAMRGLMIIAGTALLHRFEWIIYLFGGYILYAGVRMLMQKEEPDVEKLAVVRVARRILPMSVGDHGGRFFAREGGRFKFTLLFLVLLTIEFTDLIFALDSIPAIFGVTKDSFIIYTSNVCAVLGLRSLYFLLAGAVKHLVYLHVGLGFILIFIGAKMMGEDLVPISTEVSLGVVVGILAISIVASLLKKAKEERMHILDEELYQAGMALAACPTAPCHEGHVRACLQERLAGLPQVTTRIDEFGNLHARYAFEPAGREPFRVVAHMDHPAFVIRRGESGEKVLFAGGVADRYFAGGKIVFHNERTREPLGHARVEESTIVGEDRLVKLDRPAPVEATFATWDLPPARCTKKLFISPACDDLAQVSTVLALLRRLSLGGAKAEVHALFSRAEEIGFAGVLAALKTKEGLAPIPTLSLETSQARGFARVDGGPVVRVGDRLSVFDSRVTHWLEAAFRELHEARPGTVWQRLLMGGGVCEASVFSRAGFPTGALCVALNNYHNMGPGETIRSESISLRDWQGLYDFLFFLATEARSLRAADNAVEDRFARLEMKALSALGGSHF